MAAKPNIQWIEAVYGSPSNKVPGQTHIAVPENARVALEKMTNELAAGDGLVALYVREGTEDVYEPGGNRGRIISVVRLLTMPRGGKMEDYFYLDWDGSRRWPIGWPAQLVYEPPVVECPRLREYVESLFGPGTFGSYVSRFQKGPFRLEQKMRDRLNDDFARFERLV